MDVERVKELLDLMESHNLCEIEVERDGVRIRLKKNSAEPREVVAPAMVSVPAVLPGMVGHPEAPKEESPEEDTVEVTSPMVGTFYRSSAPDAEPFVSVGDQVEEDSLVCIIEAMKVMNEIRAEAEGEIVAILVESGEAVEFGQAMMILKPAAPA